MKQILQFKNHIFFIFLFINCLSYSQEKTILYNEIIHHKESGDFDTNVITLYSNIKTGKYKNTVCKNITIEKSAVQTMIDKKNKFISFELPLFEGKRSILHLKKRNLENENFKIIIQNQNSKQRSTDQSVYLAYTGLIDGEETNSLVSIVMYNDILIGSILIGNRTFSLNQIDDTNSYRLYENQPEINQPEFSCGVSDDGNSNMLKNATSISKIKTTVPKCLKLYFEITKSLNDQYGGVEKSITEFLSLFNLIQTKFANEGITVRISGLKIWNTDDPYYQTWQGTPGASGSFQDLGFYSFQQLGGNIDGNIGILLGTFSGGVAGLSGGSPCPNQGYNADTIYPNSTNQNAQTIMHEIGHNLGSHHTHWCGWIGGALDNCYATEGGCELGPTPTDGGTIMSYCGGFNIINNGFGTQPNAVILNTTANETCITSCNSDITCEDNIVSVTNVINTTASSFTVKWTSANPVKIYFKEQSASSFTLLNTVSLPDSSYTINYVPSTNCIIQKFEIKLVSVCSNGDSKPTIIVYSPQVHLKPQVGLEDNYLCNISNPTVSNLVASGQNLKWYTTETGGTPISTAYIIPLNTYFVYYVSQTVNGCESERTKSVIYIQKIASPTVESIQQFNCSSPKIIDLVAIGTNVLWWTAKSGGYSPSVNTELQNNTIYYAESRSIYYNCASERIPVLVQTNATGANLYSIPFTETFDIGLCNLGYNNLQGYNLSNGELNIYSYPNALVYTKGISVNTLETIKISLKAKRAWNNLSSPMTIKIGREQDVSTQTLISEITPSSNSIFQQYEFNFTPSNTGVYYISFSYNPNQYSVGYIIDDLTISKSKLSLVGQNIGTPWETDIDLSTNDGINYFISNYAIPSGGIKFRLDHSWTTNWGGITSSGTFPSGIGVQDGWKIPVIDGVYNVSFNKLSGSYLFSSTLGINNNELFDLNIYPNPTTNTVNILSKNETIKQINVYDMAGRLIKSQIGSSEKEQIGLQKLANAVYLIEIKTEKGSQRVKVVKK